MRAEVVNPPHNGLGDASKTRKASICDGERTLTYVTREKRSLTQYCEAYTRPSGLNYLAQVLCGDIVHIVICLVLTAHTPDKGVVHGAHARVD